MDFMKVLDQTVREIKREVNLKVLKVPEIEQKVLDATNDEAWGPHGTALQEIAQATKKFTECQMIMGVLWSRLRETDANWRHVYKALTVIEYLIANGSERALDDILGHTYQLSAISGFEYVEPNGKDSGINVRKKVETIMALLNNKEKIQAVREKAASNRDKYIGLSSEAMSSKSSSAAFGSNSYSSDHYGSFSSSRDGESYRDKYKEEDQYGYKDTRKSYGTSNENAGSKPKKDTRDQKSPPFNSSKPSTKPSLPPKSSVVQPDDDDDLDDFDPRGSSTSASANASSKQVDLFGESLVGDLLDAPLPPTKSSQSGDATIDEVDLFADADFQSASPNAPTTGSTIEENVNLFANQPAFPPPNSSNVDFFAAPEANTHKEKRSPVTESANTGVFDPFASIPLNNFDGSDPFGAFTSHSGSVTIEPSQEFTNKNHNSLHETSTAVSDFGDFTSHSDQTSSALRQQSKGSIRDVNSNSLAASKSVTKDGFQVKSGIWADSLSRGLIDLNISAPKKVNLADIGIVGGLDDASDEKEKGVFPSFQMGRAMGTRSGLGRSGFTSSATEGFSAFDDQQFGSFK